MIAFREQIKIISVKRARIRRAFVKQDSIFVRARSGRQEDPVPSRPSSRFNLRPHACRSGANKLIFVFILYEKSYYLKREGGREEKKEPTVM